MKWISPPNEAGLNLPVSTGQRKGFRDLTIPCLTSQFVFLGRGGSSYFPSHTVLLGINLLSANHGSQPVCVSLLLLPASPSSSGGLAFHGSPSDLQILSCGSYQHSASVQLNFVSGHKWAETGKHAQHSSEYKYSHFSKVEIKRNFNKRSVTQPKYSLGFFPEEVLSLWFFYFFFFFSPLAGFWKQQKQSSDAKDLTFTSGMKCCWGLVEL